MADLPTEIIIEILSRLPAESLVDFISVCKSWYSLIKSPKFIKLHLNKTLISNSNRYLLLSYCDHSPNTNLRCNHLVYSDIDLDYNHLCFFDLHHPLNHREITVFGSCNGVVCISDKSNNNVFLFNPFIKSCRKLPPNLDTNPGANKALVFGFGFDSENDDYKVLRLVQDMQYNETNYRKAEVYSLRNNSWKFVKEMPYFLLFNYRHGVLVNDAVHYIVVTEEYQMNCKFIVSFDFRTEKYSLMDCPDYADKLGGCLDLGVLGGCLNLLVMYRTQLPVSAWQTVDDPIDFRMDRADLWVMKEYGKKESWVRLFSIRDTASVGMYLQIRTIAYSKDRRKILLEVDWSGLGWCDLDDNSFNSFRGVPKAPISSGVFVGSLVSVGTDKLEEEAVTKSSTLRKNTKKKNLDNFLSTGFKLKL